MCKQRSSILELSVYTGNVVLIYIFGLGFLLIVHSVYQEYLAKTLTDKYGNLSVQMDKIINDANSEIESLHHKLDCQSRRLLLYHSPF